MIKALRRAMFLCISTIAVVYLSGCATVSPLHEAAKSGSLAEVERLIKEGADVNAKNESARTPLHMATSKDIAELLIAKGADVHARNDIAGTPLYQATSKDITELLIAKGANVNEKDRDHWTPLHSAAMNGKKEVAEFLIVKGSDVNARNIYGYTPSDLAASEGQTEVASFLKDVMTGKVKVAVPSPPEDPKEAAAFEAEAKNALHWQLNRRCRKRRVIIRCGQWPRLRINNSTRPPSFTQTHRRRPRVGPRVTSTGRSYWAS
ncbi:MAG: ankyrin repeat domain-containing protein [Deltaproteobacteria bacterium]|nr:ankyrin repeat domain-containing protein [Deltaproteobacteria bacterium]